MNTSKHNRNMSTDLSKCIITEAAGRRNLNYIYISKL